MSTDASPLHSSGERPDTCEVTASVEPDLDIALADNRRLLEELARVYEEINWLYGLGRKMEKEIADHKIFSETFIYVQNVLPVSQAEIWQIEAGEEIARRLVHFDGKQLVERKHSVPLRETCFEKLLGTGTAVLRDFDACPGPEHDFLGRLAEELGPPVVALPFRCNVSLHGVLLFRLNSEETQLNSSQLKLFTTVGRHLGLYLHLYTLIKKLRRDEGLVKELDIAKRIQEKLLPQSIPKRPRFDLYAQCITAAHVGGDYYDFFESNNGLGILIADASGHSVASGLIGVMFRTAFRHLLKLDLELSELFREINSSVYEELATSGHFLSAFYCSYDYSTNKLRYVNAGHNRPVVYRMRSGTCETLEEAGLLFGIVDSFSYQESQVWLEPGDILVSYTDGITEAENQHREQFGERRLMDAVVKYSQQSAMRMYHSILMEMYRFQDERFNKDDVTLCILKVR